MFKEEAEVTGDLGFVFLKPTSSFATPFPRMGDVRLEEAVNFLFLFPLLIFVFCQNCTSLV